MRMLALVVTIAVGTLLITSASAQDKGNPPDAPATQKPTDRIKDLQQERIATLKTMLEMETLLQRNGKASPEEVLEARVMVCEAELDAAEKESDRITVLKNLVDVFKQYEEVAKERKKAAEGTEVPVLKIKARRLEAEIRLQQAQAPKLGKANAPEPQNEKVVVTSLQEEDVVIAQQFVCQIHSRRHIDVRSLQNGYLDAIQIKEGQAVKQGDVMFKISSLRYKARLDVELAEVKLATMNLKNTERLFQNKVVSEDDLAVSKAKLASAEAKAQLAEAELGLTMIRAPFDGIVNRLQQHQGSLLTEREILTTLSDNTVMWVYFTVPQTWYFDYMSNQPKDQELEVELVLADGRKFPHPGKITVSAGQFDSETGNIPFRADFPNPDGLLRHGMTGNLSIHRTLTNAVVIPQRAIFEKLGKQYVYVVDKMDVAHQREIVIQNELPDEFVIVKGLDVSDRIVLEGIRQVHDGETLEYEFRKP